MDLTDLDECVDEELNFLVNSENPPPGPTALKK